MTRSNDLGSQFPGDGADSAPADPTDNMAEIDYRVFRSSDIFVTSSTVESSTSSELVEAIGIVRSNSDTGLRSSYQVDVHNGILPSLLYDSPIESNISAISVGSNIYLNRGEVVKLNKINNIWNVQKLFNSNINVLAGDLWLRSESSSVHIDYYAIKTRFDELRGISELNQTYHFDISNELYVFNISSGSLIDADSSYYPTLPNVGESSKTILRSGHSVSKSTFISNPELIRDAFFELNITPQPRYTNITDLSPTFSASPWSPVPDVLYTSPVPILSRVKESVLSFNSSVGFDGSNQINTLTKYAENRGHYIFTRSYTLLLSYILYTNNLYNGDISANTVYSNNSDMYTTLNPNTLSPYTPSIDADPSIDKGGSTIIWDFATVGGSSSTIIQSVLTYTNPLVLSFTLSTNTDVNA